MKDISGFFDYYYQYSDILFIPNIKISRYNIEKRKQENIIDLKGYLRFVDEIYNILNYKKIGNLYLCLSL
jgi:hypothetical protein